MTEVPCDGLRPISNMSDISCALGTFSVEGDSFAQWVYLFSINFRRFQPFALTHQSLIVVGPLQVNFQM